MNRVHKNAIAFLKTLPSTTTTTTTTTTQHQHSMFSTSIADDFAMSLRDLIPVELFPPSQTSSTRTKSGSVQQSTATATATTAGANSKSTRSPSTQSLSRAAVVQRRDRNRVENEGKTKVKSSPSSSSYLGEIDMTRTPSGFGNESFEINLGTLASRFKNINRPPAPGKRLSTLSSVSEAPGLVAKTPRIAKAKSVGVGGADDEFHLPSASAATSPTVSVTSTSSLSASSSAFLDNDLVSMPNSPWSSIRKRVGVTVPRQESPLNLASYSSLLAFAIALGWVVTVFVYSCWYYNSFGHILVELILCALMFLGVLWNTYFTTNSILKIFIPSRSFKENGAYYSVVPEEKHPDDDWASVTIQIPVYLESFEEVIKVTLTSCMESADYYRVHTGGKVNIVVCDDGIMALLQNSFEIAHLLWTMISSGKYHPTIEFIQRSLPKLAWARVKRENIREENLEEVIRRLLFYFKHDIGFVARSTLNRRGKFKKASNLNTHLRIAFGARDVQDESMMAWNDAINLLTQDDNGQQAVFCSNNIQIGNLIILNDSDARMAREVIKKTVPEFLNDEALAFTQHSTKVMDEQRGKSSFLRLIGVYTDALYQGHFLLSSIMGIPPPLVGHSTFIRTDAIRQCGRMRNLRTAQKWLNNIGLSFLGANNIRNDCLQCPVGSEYWSEGHVSEDFELMIHLYNLGYKGRYIAYPDCEFQEGVTRTFDEEATRHRKFSLGAHELMFNPFQDILGQGILTPLFKTFLTCSLPSYYKIYLASYLQSYVAGGIFVFVFVVSAIAKMLKFTDSGSIFAVTPAAVILLSFLVYYVIGYASFIIALLRMKKHNKNLLFPEYRNLGVICLIWKHIRYSLVFQFLFQFPMVFVFFFGGMDHLLSRQKMVSATNKDSMQESRWTAFKGVIRCNWGYWLLATMIAALAIGTILLGGDDEDESDDDYSKYYYDDAVSPSDEKKVAVEWESLEWGSAGNFFFAYPMLGLAFLSYAVPFLMNPYVWPIRPKAEIIAYSDADSNLVEV